MEREILVEIANNIGNDNKSVDELIDTIMKNVEKWAKEHKGELKKLTPEQRESWTQPTYLVRQIAEIEYAKENLRNIVYRNLKRAQGNLGEEERMLGLYDTLEKFNYSCPYSDTLLIGGEQPIHLEHIIPVTMGGPTDDWNCIPVCENCNESKSNRHLLDWWQDNRTVEEEYKLVRIFEHMTSKLLDNSNQIRYVETKDNTKHLDVITFLSQLLDHIEQNKQYILGPNTSILDDNTKAIESKLKELKKTFERVVKKNSDKTLKTDKQYFKEQKQMLKYVKGLGVRSYYKIAYNYFDEIQEMLNQGIDEEVIKEFCFDRDDSFNFTLFYERLIEYKEKNGSFYGLSTNKEIGANVASVRKAYKYKDDETKKGLYRLTQEMIDKLNAIEFPWEVAIEDRFKDWFTPFYEKLIIYKEKYGSFEGVSQDEEIGATVSNIRNSFKGQGNLNLTPEIIDKLDKINFTWDANKEIPYEKKIEVLTIYKNDIKGGQGTIANIRQSDKYMYQGIEYPIGVWINSFRKAKMGEALDRFQIEELEYLGMVWIKKLSDEKRMEVLRGYYNDPNGGNGSLKNLKKEGKYKYHDEIYSIGRWKRYFYDKNRIGALDKRIEKELTQMGLEWIDDEVKIEVLTAYCNDSNGGNGTISNISQKTKYIYKENGIEYNIGRWCDQYKQKKKSGTLDDVVEKALSNMGIKWEERKRISEREKIIILTAYYNDVKGGNGTLKNIRAGDIYIYQDVEYPIGEWRNTFIKAKEGRGGKISQDAEDVLKLLEFNWGTGKHVKCANNDVESLNEDEEFGL